MPRFVILDSGPLGSACMPAGRANADACRAWIRRVDAVGAVVVISAVADYEVRRELRRAAFTGGVQRLDKLKSQFLYLSVSEAAWERAADFWALLRNAGISTAGPQDLDADALLAGQAVTAAQPGDVITIATKDVRHLRLFPGVDARHWATIT